MRAGAGILLRVLPVALAAATYFPITANYFFADDFLNLYHIVDNPLPQYLVTPNGGHVLLARNAVFYASWRLFDAHPTYYFCTVLLTHLANVALAFRVIRALAGSDLLASFGAALWGTSPLSQGTLGWYSVYGQVLVATAVLVILDGALQAAATGKPPSRGVRAWWYALALVAANSFASGTAIAIVLPAMLAVLLPAGARARATRFPLLSLVIVVPLLYVAQTWAYERLSGVDLQVATGLRLLLSDVGAIALFGVGLLGFGLTGLVAGPFVSPAPAVWYAVLGTFAVMVVAALWTATRDEGRRLLVCLMLLLTAYGIIAMGRGSLATVLIKSTLGAVPLVPRYHYVGQLCLTLLLATVLARLARIRPGAPGRIVVGAWYVAAAIANVGWSPPIDHHADARAGTQEAVSVMWSAIAAVPRGGTVRIENRTFTPLPFVPTLFPGWAAVFTIFFPDNVVDGRRIYFVERNLAVLEVLRSGRRTSTLLVAP